MKILAISIALAISLSAETKFEYWPGSSYDPAVPTAKQVLGYEPGDRISTHANILKYVEALAGAAPDRMKIFDYGKTWEGRRLVYAAVGSKENIARLTDIRAAMQRLADPRKTSEADARKLISDLPAVIWLGYGVHGNEISSPDAALYMAYHLLAARGDRMAQEILSKTLVLIDPLQNPDGRDRFVHNFEIAEGLEPDANPLAAEHNEPWPGGRSNHYFFDMNRDWLTATQPETRGRIRALLDWYPLVFVDLHEMGSDSTYYFTPEAEPYNPHLTKDEIDSLQWFGKNNARWFDKFGFSYFTREVYDAFYPGYGASWPSYYGGVAMTYEQASTRGLVVRRYDETLNTYRETVRQHFVASLSTAETAAAHRDELLRNFYNYRKSAIEEGGREPIREYILPRRGNTSAVDKLVHELVVQGVEVKRASLPFQGYPEGSYVISLAQPSKRLVRTMLDPVVAMDEKFLKAEEYRRKARLPGEIYDVTAWSVPLQYGVEALSSAEVSKGNFEVVRADESLSGRVIGGEAEVAYLVPWGTSAAARFLAAALRDDLRVASTDKGFVQNGRKFPDGTLIVRVKENDARVHQRVAALAKTSGAEVFATGTGWVEEGVNFGSRYVWNMRRPTIALAWDRPTASSSAGHTRFVLERQYGYPVTVVRTQQLAAGDLGRFQVIILPDAGGGEGYAGVLGVNGVRRLKDWVEEGGTLIGLGAGAVSFLADPRTALLAIAQENVARPEPPKRPEPAAPPAGVAAVADPRTPGKIFTSAGDYEKAILPDTELPDAFRGVLLKAKVNPDHWVTAGVPETVYALAQGRAIFTPIKLDKGVNAAVFSGPEDVLASGYLWDESRKQLAYKPFVVVQRTGRGFVIGFTADPNYRAYLDGLNVLFLNAVFRGPARTR